MWNRVVLLVAGVALGWNLVHYLTAPPERVRRHQLWMVVSAVAGVGISASLVPAFGAPALGMGLAVLVASALVAYAGNAREISKMEEPLPRALPQRSATTDARVVVLLAVDGEPPAYDGPAAWAQRFRRREAAGVCGPHWFVRPWVYRRVRAAYGRLAPGATLQGWLGSLAADLEQALGPGYLGRVAYLAGTPSLACTSSASRPSSP